MQLVAIIEASWGWTGLKPLLVVGDNAFGNLIVKDVEERYWRLCPEDLYCRVIAASRSELDTLSSDQDFLRDWSMTELTRQAKERWGPLRPGFKYCLKIPGALEANTVETISPPCRLKNSSLRPALSPDRSINCLTARASIW